MIDIIIKNASIIISTDGRQEATMKSVPVLRSVLALCILLAGCEQAEKPTAKTAAALTLVTPSGFRIEGIATKDLIKVLRGLK